MPAIDFSGDEKAILVRKLQLYFNEELKQQIGQFDAECLLDFLSNELVRTATTVGCMTPKSF